MLSILSMSFINWAHYFIYIAQLASRCPLPAAILSYSYCTWKLYHTAHISHALTGASLSTMLQSQSNKRHFITQGQVTLIFDTPFSFSSYKGHTILRKLSLNISGFSRYLRLLSHFYHYTLKDNSKSYYLILLYVLLIILLYTTFIINAANIFDIFILKKSPDFYGCLFQWYIYFHIHWDRFNI